MKRKYTNNLNGGILRIIWRRTVNNLIHRQKAISTKSSNIFTKLPTLSTILSTNNESEN